MFGNLCLRGVTTTTSTTTFNVEEYCVSLSITNERCTTPVTQRVQMMDAGVLVHQVTLTNDACRTSRTHTSTTQVRRI
jgi:hypothetical protein